jgi:hypothetical protein
LKVSLTEKLSLQTGDSRSQSIHAGEGYSLGLSRSLRGSRDGFGVSDYWSQDLPDRCPPGLYGECFSGGV